jgi:large subunit ribosomal protein L9
VSVTVHVNVARSPEEAELQAQGIDVIKAMFEEQAAPIAAEALAPEAEETEAEAEAEEATAEEAPAEEVAPAAEEAEEPEAGAE